MFSEIDFLSITLVLISVFFIIIFWQSKKIKFISLPCFFAIFFLIRVAYPSIYIAYKYNDKYSEKLLLSICLSMIFMILGFLIIAFANGDIRGIKFIKWYYHKIEKTYKFDITFQNIFFTFLLFLTCLYIIMAPRIALFEMFSYPGAYFELQMAREESMKLAGFGYLAYVFEWTRRTFFPLLYAWSYFSSGFSFKTKIIFFVAIFYSLLTTAKGPIAMFLLIVILAYLVKNRKPLLNLKLILAGSTVVLVIPVIILRAISPFQGWTMDLITRSFMAILNRIFIVTAEVPYYWFVYFPDVYGSFLYGASNSMYSKIFRIDFVPAPNLVYQFMYPRDIESGFANSAFFADAYANFGFMGIIISSWLVGFILAISHFYFIKRKKNPFVAACYVCLYLSFFNLLSTSLTTALLSGGILIILLFAFTFPRFKKIALSF